jgi:hypothetical protein
MRTRRYASIGAMGFLDRVLGRRDPERQRRLVAASAAVDRELAANLELSSMFDTTHQAFVFENAAFGKHDAALKEDMRAAAYEAVAVVYRDMAAVETAMERRGPANSIRPDDRALIETWEGNVRVAQRALRDAPAQRPPSVWQSFLARLGGGKQTGR